MVRFRLVRWYGGTVQWYGTVVRWYGTVVRFRLVRWYGGTVRWYGTVVRLYGMVVRLRGTVVRWYGAVMRYSGIIMYGWHGSKAQFLVRCLMIDTFVSKEKGTLYFFWILYLARTISVETFEAQTGKYSGILVR